MSDMNDRIVIDPGIQHGKPVIKGTRVPVARVIGGLAGGMTKEEIVREYQVSEQDIRAGQMLDPNKLFLCQPQEVIISGN